MRIRGHEYRFVHIPDPPFPYGVGVDDPDTEFWVVPAHAGQPTRVWVRPKFPVEDGESVEPWVEIERKDLDPLLPLFWLGDQLSQLEVEGWECRVCHRPAETAEARCPCPEGSSHCPECHEEALRGLRETVEMVRKRWPRSLPYWERRLKAMEEWRRV